MWSCVPAKRSRKKVDLPDAGSPIRITHSTRNHGTRGYNAPLRPMPMSITFAELNALEATYESQLKHQPQLEHSAEILIETARILSEDIAAWQELYGRKRLNLPAYVTGRRWDILVWNAAAEEIFAFSRLAEGDRNVLLNVLTNRATRRLFGAS